MWWKNLRKSAASTHSHRSIGLHYILANAHANSATICSLNEKT